jgi:hypothetical protein
VTTVTEHAEVLCEWVLEPLLLAHAAAPEQLPWLLIKEFLLPWRQDLYRGKHIVTCYSPQSSMEDRGEPGWLTGWATLFLEDINTGIRPPGWGSLT